MMSSPRACLPRTSSIRRNDGENRALRTSDSGLRTNVLGTLLVRSPKSGVRSVLPWLPRLLHLREVARENHRHLRRIERTADGGVHLIGGQRSDLSLQLFIGHERAADEQRARELARQRGITCSGEPSALQECRLALLYLLRAEAVLQHLAHLVEERRIDLRAVLGTRDRDRDPLTRAVEGRHVQNRLRDIAERLLDAYARRDAAVERLLAE